MEYNIIFEQFGLIHFFEFSISSLSFIMFGVSEHTNKITELERQAVQLGWTDAFKEEQISKSEFNNISGLSGLSS